MTLTKPYENIFTQTPYLHSSICSKKMMFDVFLMLIFICISAVVLFGIKAFFILIIGVSTAFTCAYLIKFQDQSFFISSSVWINGILILMLILPASVPWFIPVLGVFLYFFIYLTFKIEHHQIFHPVLLTKLVLYLLFPSIISDKPPTLFQIMRQYSINWFQANFIIFDQKIFSTSSAISLWDILWGNIPGNIGDNSLILSFIALIYLGIRNIFFIFISLTYLTTLFLLVLFFSGLVNSNIFPLDIVGFLTQNSILFFSVFVLPYFATQPVLISRKANAAFLSALGVFILGVQGIWLPQTIIFLLIGALTPIFDTWPNRPYFGYYKKLKKEKYNFSWKIFSNKIKHHSLNLILALFIMITMYLLNVLIKMQS